MISLRPRMIGSPPRSEWDIAGERELGHPPPEGFRFVPSPAAKFDDYPRYTWKSVEELYREDCVDRGRPPMFTLDQARAIKQAFWSGGRTIVSLAKEHICTRVTIGRLVHGKTMWYA